MLEIKAFKNKVSTIVHKMLLPRGLKYVHRPDLENRWEKGFVRKRNKSICYLLLRSDTNSNKGIVILSHPYLAEAKTFYLIRGHADMYAKNGFSVVVFDYNGFGESPFVDFDYAEDLSMVASFIHSQIPVSTMFGHGVSFGASHTISYCTLDTHHFQKIIIENCLDSNLSYYKVRNRKLYFMVRVLMALFPNMNKDHNYVKSISKLKGLQKVLLVYNHHDELTTIAMGQALLKACSVPVSIGLFDGAHLNAYEDNCGRYEKEMISFLEK